jgi:polar amino acid transport system permease protein
MIEDLQGFLQVYVENWPDWGPQIYAAIWVTIQLTAASFALAIGLGLLLAIGKLSPLRLVRAFCTGYIEIARGVPVLAILFLLYFGLVPLGLVFDAFTAGVIGLASAWERLAISPRSSAPASRRSTRVNAKRPWLWA